MPKKKNTKIAVKRKPRAKKPRAKKRVRKKKQTKGTGIFGNQFPTNRIGNYSETFF